ncbi:MAG: hypothetical protein QOJ64_187 [Acidobacteriota bacterium]|jgi:hypothetical protein|nr:hypothetical protein [Acidobacteriota bacterium]
MSKLTLLVILLIAPTSIAVRFDASGPYKSPKIGVIKRPLARTGGCNLQLPKDYKQQNNSYVFVDYDYQSKGAAQINVNGKDLMLRLVRRTEEDFQMKVGYRYFEEYASGNTRLRVDYVVRGVCPPNDEQCSVVVLSGVLTVRHKEGMKKIKTIGLCGS